MGKKEFIKKSIYNIINVIVSFFLNLEIIFNKY